MMIVALLTGFGVGCLAVAAADAAYQDTDTQRVANARLRETLHNATGRWAEVVTDAGTHTGVVAATTIASAVLSDEDGESFEAIDLTDIREVRFGEYA